jgi:2'-5' RNA ligase
MSKIRIFIAIDIPETQRAHLASLQSELRPLGGRVSWPRPEGIHLTLKFLGDVEESRINEVADAVTKAAVGRSSFKIRIAGTGAFPNVRRPRVLWVGVKDSSGLVRDLARSIENNLKDVGFPRENREFSPHLTLGRVKESRGVEPLMDRLRGEKFDAGEFEVKEVVVVRSDLKPTGAVYTPLRRIPLSS